MPLGSRPLHGSHAGKFWPGHSHNLPELRKFAYKPICWCFSSGEALQDCRFAILGVLAFLHCQRRQALSWRRLLVMRGAEIDLKFYLCCRLTCHLSTCCTMCLLSAAGSRMRSRSSLRYASHASDTSAYLCKTSVMVLVL